MDIKNCIGNCESCCCDGEVCDLLESIALQETALAHILNAEGEKIQKAIASNASVDKLLAINCTVADVIGEVTKLEMLLTDKLAKALKYDCGKSPCGCEGRVVISTYCCGDGRALSCVNVKVLDDTKAVIFCGQTDACGKLALCLNCAAYTIELSCNGKLVKKNITISCDRRHVYIAECFDCATPPCPVCDDVKFSGKVTDACGNVIGGACVFVEGETSARAIANNYGYYTFSMSACDVVKLMATASGARSATKTIYENGETQYTVNFVVKQCCNC